MIVNVARVRPCALLADSVATSFSLRCWLSPERAAPGSLNDTVCDTFAASERWRGPSRNVLDCDFPCLRPRASVRTPLSVALVAWSHRAVKVMRPTLARWLRL